MFTNNFKVIIIGDLCTGKTSYVKRLLNHPFDGNYKPTNFLEFNTKTFKINETPYFIQLWDLSGQDINQNVAKGLARDSHGCIVMTDATDVINRKR